MAAKLPYIVRCPMCEYLDTWIVILSDDPSEGALALRERRTFAEELAAEHPHHPKPRVWPDAS